MATVVPNIEKPVVIFTAAHNLTKFISLNGNYQDIINVMIILCRYERVFTTGQAPIVKKVRGGKEASSVSALEKALSDHMSYTNALHDFNHLRDNFYRNVAIRYPSFYSDIDSNKELVGRMCLKKIIFGEEDIYDCEGTYLATAHNDAEYISIWNTQKVPADLAVCGQQTPYHYLTYIPSYFGTTYINPDNNAIPYNATDVIHHGLYGKHSSRKSAIVNEENRHNPKSISSFSAKEI